MRIRTPIAALLGVLAMLFAGGLSAAAHAEAPAPSGDVIALQCGYSGGHPTISQGSTGEAVAHAQCLLRNVWGYGSVVVDGVFGPATRAAVVAHQRDCGIGDDGIVGPNTWNALHPDTAPSACG